MLSFSSTTRTGTGSAERASKDRDGAQVLTAVAQDGIYLPQRIERGDPDVDRVVLIEPVLARRAEGAETGEPDVLRQLHTREGCGRDQPPGRSMSTCVHRSRNTPRPW